MVNGDELLPMFVQTAGSTPVLVLFTLGIVAASFSSADSALTALTTSYCVDIRQRSQDERLRRRVHVMMCLLLVVCILAIRAAGSASLIDAIYTIVSYTYGPLLGLFAFGLFTRRGVRDKWVPIVCIASPLLCFLLDQLCANLFNYRFGYELLLLNGLITFVGLMVMRSNGQ